MPRRCCCETTCWRRRRSTTRAARSMSKRGCATSATRRWRPSLPWKQWTRCTKWPAPTASTITTPCSARSGTSARRPVTSASASMPSSRPGDWSRWAGSSRARHSNSEFRVRRLLYHHLDQRRLVARRREPLLQRLLNVAGLGHADAFGAAGFRDIGETRTLEQGPVDVAVDVLLLHGGLAEGTIVQHHHQDVCAILHRGGQVADRHQESAVTGERHHVALRELHLGDDRGR